MVSRFLKKLIRAFAFFRIGFNNFDWDYSYLHELVLFKLKRMQKAFENGYHSPDCENYKPKVKSLALTIKLLDRYCNKQEIYDRPLNRHDAKWGELETQFLPSEAYGDYYKFVSSRPNANTETEKEQEEQEFLAAYRAHEVLRDRDVKIAYSIIAKYYRYWWD